MFSMTEKAGNEHEILEHHADPTPHRVGRCADIDQIIFNVNRTAIRLLIPVQDLHQRAFPGPVFPQKGMDFALFHRKMNPAIGEDSRK